ncbi:MAG: hypothetical protein ABIQ73_23895 [Acidimicrobiales bacterium]
MNATLSPSPSISREALVYPSTTREVLALGRAEARRTVRNKGVWVFVLLTPLLVIAATDGNHLRWQASIELILGLVPLGWAVMVATNLAALRDRRHRVSELADTLPAAPATRTAGLLLGGLVLVPVVAVLLAVTLIVMLNSNELSGSPAIDELAVGLLIIGGASIVGVAVARWLPRSMFVVPAIFVTIALADSLDKSSTSRVRFLGFRTPPSPSLLPALDDRPTLWHLVWLATWCGLMAAVALARHGVGRRLGVAFVTLAVLAMLSGVAQIASASAGEAAARADVLNRPADHQRCENIGAVDYCAYANYDDRIDEWQQVISAVLAHVPSAVAGQLREVHQRAEPVVGNSLCRPSDYLSVLEAPVRKKVSIEQAWFADGQIHPGLSDESLPCNRARLNLLWTAVQAGAWAVGLPPTRSYSAPRCVADGQARAVIALWLGNVASGKLQQLSDVADTTDSGALAYSGWDTPPPWGVEFARADTAAALALAGVATADFDRMLADHWDELVDPSTSSARLFALLNLPAPADSAGSPRPTCPERAR